MRKAARLFEIIQILRLAHRPITAAHMAGQMEVTQRSVYRDIAALQAMRVPIDGERGLGYILRPGFELPPLMFSVTEVEAIVLGMALLERTADTELKAAARRVSSKVEVAVPPPLRPLFSVQTLHAWGTVQHEPPAVDLSIVRQAIRDEQKLMLHYRNVNGEKTQRVIRPIAMIYYAETTNIVAWCELRASIRNFRADRVLSVDIAEEYFRGEGDSLRAGWMKEWMSN